MYATPSAARLARVFAGPGRPVLEALAALDAEWRLAVRDGIDHGVAHTKLAWWRAELGRLAAGRPAHPLTQALSRLAVRPPDVGLLEARLDAADLALGGFAAASLAELEALAARSHGSLWQLAAALLAPDLKAAALAGAASLGRAFGLLARAAAGAVPAAIEAGALEARARALIAASELALPVAGTPALAGLGVARALARARGAGAAPGPFVQLWVAWRAAREAHHATPPRAAP